MNQYFKNTSAHRGLTLIELMITIVIIGILAAIAVPNYSRYVVRASRQAAQSDLMQLSTLQEKIYLNSNAYSASVTAAYTGNSTGGLGRTSGQTSDGKYNITVAPTTPGQSFTLTATPVTTSSQASDGAITISSTGARLRNGASW